MSPRWPDRRQPGRTTTALWVGAAVVALAAILVAGVQLSAGSNRTPGTALASNPDLDPGTALSGQAPDFMLSDQFGRRISLRSFRGKVVILAFNDSECTTICPLTTSAMVDAKAMLGRASSQVQLLGIDANPAATAIADVRAYSELHGMVHQWHFLTGSPTRLRRVWSAYKIAVAIEQGQIDHTPALFVIDPRGRLSRLYLTQQSYAAIPQLGQLLAEQASRLLPSHPRVRSSLSYTHLSGLAPTARLAIPRAGGGTLALGSGTSAHLYLFFATWDQQVMNLRAHLDALNAYQRSDSSARLPALSAIDEASVEPSPQALPALRAHLPRPLSYPIGIDRSGRVADGYGVQDEPWFVLTSSAGRVLWYYDIATSGWLTTGALKRQVRNALTQSSRGAPSAASDRAELAGSPAPLAALHAQAGALLGGVAELAARIRELRGYPIVLNAWGSWCGPCRAEFGLLAVAATRYGRRVAFLGADVNDDASDARAFLAQHPVSYPSYEMSTGQLAPIVPQGLVGTPTTIYINRRGKIVAVHTGEYDSQGSLDGDIQGDAMDTGTP